MKITLKAARINAGLTQLEVAKELGVSTRTLRTYEGGSVVPKKGMFKTMCELYRIDENNIEEGIFFSSKISENRDSNL